MQNRYGKDGLVVVSVNLDDPARVPLRAKVEKFLKDQKATTTNLILDEKEEVVLKKFHFEGELPTVFVFNRAGKYVRFPSPGKEDFNHTDIAKQAAEFLKAGP